MSQSGMYFGDCIVCGTDCYESEADFDEEIGFYHEECGRWKILSRSEERNIVTLVIQKPIKIDCGLVDE